MNSAEKKEILLLIKDKWSEINADFSDKGTNRHTRENAWKEMSDIATLGVPETFSGQAAETDFLAKQKVRKAQVRKATFRTNHKHLAVGSADYQKFLRRPRWKRRGVNCWISNFS
ncbi:hypothetical protein DdX_20490 [Ditylenchus destructor]|uniref:Uncharacterized protein n=1 Tax=Ditylenchus destructor TaxID=166010 RepID=A0AAD4MH41_9BILA|nr:hypothetical protein DdX_20490 [Ditylenchus destructor]